VVARHLRLRGEQAQGPPALGAAPHERSGSARCERARLWGYPADNALPQGETVSGLLILLLVLLLIFAVGGGILVSKLLWLLLVAAVIVLVVGLFTGRTA
jgi:hypothetical protein